MNDLVERFSKKYIKQGDCWVWQGCLDKDGYGRMRVGGRKYKTAHRLAYELFVGEIGDKLVCHHCDNPSCVRPDHLFLGTAKDNWQDMLRKGRGKFKSGQDNGLAKLTNDQANKVFILYAEGKMTHKEIGSMFGVSGSLVQRILSGRAWKHVDAPRLSSMRNAPKRALRKLGDHEIAAVIAAYKNREGSQKEIGRRFGISQTVVSRWVLKYG